MIISIIILLSRSWRINVKIGKPELISLPVDGRNFQLYYTFIDLLF